VPIWISGTIRDTTVRRLVQFGTRWIPWGKDDGDMTVSLPLMREAIAKAGGNPDALQASGPLPAVWGENRQMDLARTMDRVPGRVAAGQTDFMLPFYEPDVSKAEGRLREIVQAFRSATGRAA
jgi:hypothetical protein